MEKLYKKIIDIQGHNNCLMSFSGGKDSIAMFLRILESGLFDKIYLYHYYLIPELSWISNFSKYFEKKFDVKILNLPSPTFYRLLSGASFQTPATCAAIQKIQNDDDGFINFNLNDLSDVAKEYFNLSENTYTAIGITVYDSALRRKAITHNEGINHNSKKWYPVHDMKLNDIKNIINKHNVKLPDDYKLFGLSFDGLDYRFIKVIKDQKPDDYKKIKQYFPLIDLVIERHEKYYGDVLKKGRAYGWI